MSEAQVHHQHLEPLHTRVRPRPVMRLNRKAIAVLLGSVGLLVLLALRLGVHFPRTRADADRARVPRAPTLATAPGLNELPASYDQVPQPEPPQLPTRAAPTPVISQASPPATVTPPRVSEVAKERDAARRSSLFFQSSPRAERRWQHPSRADSQPEIPPRDGPRPSGLALLNQLAQHPQSPMDQNRQEDKEAFLRQVGQADVPIYLHDRLHDPVSPHVVQAGTVIPAVLLTGINADLPGMITAQVREPVYDSVSGETLLIPQGTRLLGQYDSKIVYGQRRVLVAWQRLILPDGASIRLEGMPGIDLAGFAGLKDQVNNHWGRIFGSVLLSTVLSVGARLPAGMVSRDRGISPGEEFALEASANINSAGQEIVRKNVNIQPTLEIRPGYALNILVHRDMVLRPYEF